MSHCGMQLPSALNKVAVVGTGVIGSGWAALFCAKGYSVVAYVRSKGSQAKFMKSLESSYQKLVARGLAADPNGYKAVSCVFNLAECVSDADYVQESVLEDLATKQHIIHEIDHFAPPNVIIGSSTSFIPLSLLRTRARQHPERVAIAHPSLPQWDAFCEVLGSSDEITAWLADLYGGPSGSAGPGDIVGLGMDVIRMRCEAHGHVLNTFFMSNILAGISLVRTGVCDAAACDTALLHFCRMVTAAGGLGGAFRLVGGGSSQAWCDLATDIATGLPLGKTASWASWVLPAWLLMPSLRLAQLILRPLQLFSGAMRSRVSRLYRPFYEKWDESSAGHAAFESLALSNVCSLEALASDARQTPLANLGGA
jgi:carnitine 3-dehydrogenase